MTCFSRGICVLLHVQGALDAVLGEVRAAGLYDEGVADLRASSVTLKNPPEDVARDPATGAITKLAQARRTLQVYCVSSGMIAYARVLKCWQTSKPVEGRDSFVAV